MTPEEGGAKPWKPARGLWRRVAEEQRQETLRCMAAFGSPDAKAAWGWVRALHEDVVSTAAMNAFVEDLIAEALGESHRLVRVQGGKWRMVTDPQERDDLESALPEEDRCVVFTKDPPPEAFQILIEACAGT